MSISLDSITFPSISGLDSNTNENTSPPVNGPEQIVGANSSNSYVIPLAFIVIIVVVIAYYILFKFNYKKNEN